MLAGMPTHYHISCRVRNSEAGLDAQVTEHADVVIETSGTACVAFTQWATTKGSWIHASGAAIKSLLEMSRQDTEQPGRSELDIMGWDSRENGGDSYSDGYHNDWNVSRFEFDRETHTLEIDGTSCCGEFEFELRITPHDPSKVSSQEIVHTQEYTDARYLLALSEKILAIPVQYGTDQSDHDELRAIAARLDQQAVTDALNDT